MAQTGPSKKSLEGVERTVRILHVLRDRSEATLTEVARDAELSEATVLRYLSSLSSFGYVERIPGNRYRLGWEVFRLGQHAAPGAVPRAEALPIMEELLDRFNETVNLAYRKDDEVVIVEVLHGHRAIKRLTAVGQVDPWHASAVGKALLSTMPPADQVAVLKRAGLPRFTPHTLVDIAAVQADIAATMKHGYTIDREEAEEDLTCLAAPVPASAGPSQFALSVSFLSHRLKARNLDEVAQAIVSAADELGKRLAI
ncbi:IclR family transcriptional regulator [Amycolatopsis pigmentata]|uniref:IclR family transcriptional regulator n=1 Tax=Amycolatopsis pigmentata TaxID=450801 RepID=A0ABW5FNF4_9PSEU